MDTQTESLAKGCLPRVCIQIDMSTPLVPGTIIDEDTSRFWQLFVYESIPVLCYKCGRIEHSEACCPYCIDGIRNNNGGVILSGDHMKVGVSSCSGYKSPHGPWLFMGANSSTAPGTKIPSKVSNNVRKRKRETLVQQH